MDRLLIDTMYSLVSLIVNPLTFLVDGHKILQQNLGPPIYCMPRGATKNQTTLRPLSFPYSLGILIIKEHLVCDTPYGHPYMVTLMNMY